MKTCWRSFNTYLLLLAILFTAGCASEASKKKKEMSTLRLHLEVNNDGTGANGPVQVTHEKFQVNVDKDPFLMEDDVAHASVVSTPEEGFAIQIQFTGHGALKLDMVTSSQKGHRIAILTQFPKSRWVAAPMITKRISTGILVFTPDCTREEAERICNGLNNVALKVKKESSFF